MLKKAVMERIFTFKYTVTGEDKKREMRVKAESGEIATRRFKSAVRNLDRFELVDVEDEV